jgi:hypothetical protein
MKAVKKYQMNRTFLSDKNCRKGLNFFLQK